MKTLTATIEKFKMQHGILISSLLFLCLLTLSKTDVEIFSYSASSVLFFLSEHFGYFLSFFFLYGFHCLFYCKSYLKKIEKKTKVKHEEFEQSLKVMLGGLHALFCFVGLAFLAWLTSPTMMAHLTH